eukprot:9247668-Alexandrium_andersonii.AAC.1
MLDRPQHDGVANRDLPLDPALKRERQNPDLPLQLLHRVLDGAIRLWSMGRRTLENHLEGS